MRSSVVASALSPSLLCLPSLARAAVVAPNLAPVIQQRQDSPGFVSLPFKRVVNTPALQARQATDLDVPLYNVTTISYLVEISVGTPGQDVRVAIDTGSSELWVNPNCKTVDTQDEYQDCVNDGQFDPDQSSTMQDLETRSEITYGIGKVEIAYIKDNVAFPNSTVDLKSIQFGAAIATQDLSEGIMGLGFGNASSPKALSYANIVDQMYMQGVTKSRAFSVSLGNQDQNDGGILVFGGLDTGKFSGSLVSLPILGPQNGENIPRYWVEMQSLGATINGNTHTYSNSAIPVVIDTGSTLCNLPTAIVQDMVSDTEATVDNQGDVVVKCSLAQNNSTFNFVFNGLTIAVPFSQFIYPIPGSSTQCILGVSPSDSVALLGDSFIRSAYIVFDQTHMQISMAPYADCGTSEQSIGSGAVGSVKGQCNTTTTGSGAHSDGNVLTIPARITMAALALLSVLACL